MPFYLLLIVPLVAGYLLDLIFGDPETWPHPVRLFGNTIAWGEKLLNSGSYRFLKGGAFAFLLCAACFLFFGVCSWLLIHYYPVVYLVFSTVFVFFGLANKGLIDEGCKVFNILDAGGLGKGRAQLSRIVGRDTANLNHQQIRIAVLETMSENLSDGVIAPLFYYALAGIPGMMTYKMINTLDSMVGYRNERYEQFGKFSARLDDVVNFIPARFTAFVMALVTLSSRSLRFITLYGANHKSPNSGYPEAALAGIMDTRFGGPNLYKGILVDKPFIGVNPREISHSEFDRASSVNHRTCFFMILVASIFIWTLYA